MRFGITAAPTLRQFRYTTGTLVSVVLCALFTVTALAGCSEPVGDEALTKNVYLELVDWHVAGFWVINSPVAWLRVANYNTVPVKDVTFEYFTYDYAGTQLNHDKYTMDGVVPAGQMKNFIEQYLPNIDLNSQHLSVKILRVSRAD